MHFDDEISKVAELLEAALSALRAGSDRPPRRTSTRVGTMGPLTCSAEALTMYLHRDGGAGVPLYYESFEQVRAALLAGEIDQALVPHCHPIAHQLLFDPRFAIDMEHAFDKPNPPLYLAALSNTPFPPATEAKCAALPTLWPLLGELPQRLTLVAALSNPAAAKAVVKGETSYAITNEASLAAYELKALQTLKHVVVRWFPVSLRKTLADCAPLRSAIDRIATAP